MSAKSSLAATSENCSTMNGNRLSKLRPLAFLLAFLSTLALAQTAEPPKASDEQNDKTTKVEPQGNLESTQTLGCIPLAEAKNTYTPPDLHTGITACVAEEKYDLAARLFALSGIYGAFDSARVTDRSAAKANVILILILFTEMDPAKKRKLEEAVISIAADTALLANLCNEVRSVGMPNYYPAYMINHGINSRIGNPDEGALAKDFDSSKVWADLQTTYLKCPAGQEAAAPAAKPNAVEH